MLTPCVLGQATTTLSPKVRQQGIVVLIVQFLDTISNVKSIVRACILILIC